MRPSWGFPGGLVVRNQHANAGVSGDAGLIRGLERCPGEENGNSLQYSCLGNPMERGAWQATVHVVAEESTTTLKINNNRHYNYVFMDPRQYF